MRSASRSHSRSLSGSNGPAAAKSTSSLARGALALNSNWTDGARYGKPSWLSRPRSATRPPIRGSRRNHQPSPSWSSSMSCSCHGALPVGRAQTSCTASGSRSPSGHGRKAPGGSAAKSSQPVSARWATCWSPRSRSTSVSPCARVRRPTNRSMAHPPAIHQGARTSRKSAPVACGDRAHHGPRPPRAVSEGPLAPGRSGRRWAG